MFVRIFSRSAYRKAVKYFSVDPKDVESVVPPVNSSNRVKFYSAGVLVFIFTSVGVFAVTAKQNNASIMDVLTRGPNNSNETKRV